MLFSRGLPGEQGQRQAGSYWEIKLKEIFDEQDC
jgi:hypothetical protein